MYYQDIPGTHGLVLVLEMDHPCLLLMGATPLQRNNNPLRSVTNATSVSPNIRKGTAHTQALTPEATHASQTLENTSPPPPASNLLPLYVENRPTPHPAPPLILYMVRNEYPRTRRKTLWDRQARQIDTTLLSYTAFANVR